MAMSEAEDRFGLRAAVRARRRHLPARMITSVLIAGGLHEAIDALQQDLNSLHELIHSRYFVLPSLAPAATATSDDLACAPA